MHASGIQIHVGSTITDVSVFAAIHATIRQVLADHQENFKHVKIIRQDLQFFSTVY
jgi:hypothetical protein